MPSIETQSPRFGVISTSRIVSPALQHLGERRADLRARVEHEDAGVLVAESPSSRAEQIMPSETSPRIFDFFSFVPSGSVAPGSATATFWPGRDVRRAAHDR